MTESLLGRKFGSSFPGTGISYTLSVTHNITRYYDLFHRDKSVGVKGNDILLLFSTDSRGVGPVGPSDINPEQVINTEGRRTDVLGTPSPVYSGVC